MFLCQVLGHKWEQLAMVVMDLPDAAVVTRITIKALVLLKRRVRFDFCRCRRCGEEDWILFGGSDR